MRIDTTYGGHTFCRGAAEGKFPQNAFDGALLVAGIGNCNLIKVSSIVPPGSVLLETISPLYGQLLPVAYATISSNKPKSLIAAAVAVAYPVDPDKPGLIMEVSGVLSEAEVRDQAIEMARLGMHHRGWEIAKINAASIEHMVEQCGACIAAVALVHPRDRRTDT